MSISLLNCMGQVPLAVVDVETTGASPRWGDRVTEVGIVRYESGQPVASYSALIDPRRPISLGVQALTGITQEMVTGQPTFAERLEEMLPLLCGAVIVGHNIRFDLGFLGSEFRRARRPIGQAVARGGKVHVLDTVRLARRRFGRGGNALQTLARRFGFFPEVAHRALADAETTGQVLFRLLEPAGGLSCMLVDALSAQGGPIPLEGPPARGNEDLPMELLDAIEAGGTVNMIYLDARGQRSERLIQPLRLRRFRGTATLVAHCLLRDEQRTFKLERIVSLVATSQAAPTPEAMPPAEHVDAPATPPASSRLGEQAELFA